MAKGRDPALDTGRPNLQRGPVEQQTLDDDPPFKNGGRRADLPTGGYQQRASADRDYAENLARNAREDKQAVGQPKALDGTPWQRGSGRRSGV